MNIASSDRVGRNEVQERLLQWNSVDFETAAASRGMCATALRSFDEWDQTEQAKALTGVLPIEIRKIGDAPARAASPSRIEGAQRPLEGIRILDLSRVLAGPVAGRTLAGIQKIPSRRRKTSTYHVAIFISSRRLCATSDVPVTSKSPCTRYRYIQREADDSTRSK